MFPKRNRLSKEEIEDILLKGTRIHSPHLVLVFKKNTLQNKDRFTVIVSKKVSPQAVERNKIKRRLRAILKKSDNKKEGFRNGVLITKSKILKLSYDTLKYEVETLLNK